MVPSQRGEGISVGCSLFSQKEIAFESQMTRQALLLTNLFHSADVSYSFRGFVEAILFPRIFFGREHAFKSEDAVIRGALEKKFDWESPAARVANISEKSCRSLKNRISLDRTLLLRGFCDHDHVEREGQISVQHHGEA